MEVPTVTFVRETVNLLSFNSHRQYISVVTRNVLL